MSMGGRPAEARPRGQPRREHRPPGAPRCRVRRKCSPAAPEHCRLSAKPGEHEPRADHAEEDAPRRAPTPKQQQVEIEVGRVREDKERPARDQKQHQYCPSNRSRCGGCARPLPRPHTQKRSVGVPCVNSTKGEEAVGVPGWGRDPAADPPGLPEWLTTAEPPPTRNDHHRAQVEQHRRRPEPPVRWAR